MMHRHILSSQNTIETLWPVNRTRNIRASPIASDEIDRDAVCLITGHRRRRQHPVTDRKRHSSVYNTRYDDSGPC